MSETQPPKIEKGIPIPKEKYGKTKAILNAMAIGDSMLLPNKTAASMRAVAWEQGIKACTRKVSETETRIWRMS